MHERQRSRIEYSNVSSPDAETTIGESIYTDSHLLLDYLSSRVDAVNRVLHLQQFAALMLTAPLPTAARRNWSPQYALVSARRTGLYSPLRPHTSHPRGERPVLKLRKSRNLHENECRVTWPFTNSAL